MRARYGGFTACRARRFARLVAVLVCCRLRVRDYPAAPMRAAAGAFGDTRMHDTPPVTQRRGHLGTLKDNVEQLLSHRNPFYVEQGLVMAFEVAWADVVGMDYAARLMEDARLVLEARSLAKRVFASVGAGRVPSFFVRAAAAPSSLLARRPGSAHRVALLCACCARSCRTHPGAGNVGLWLPLCTCAGGRCRGALPAACAHHAAQLPGGGAGVRAAVHGCVRLAASQLLCHTQHMRSRQRRRRQQGWQRGGVAASSAHCRPRRTPGGQPPCRQQRWWPAAGVAPGSAVDALWCGGRCQYFSAVWHAQWRAPRAAQHHIAGHQHQRS